jgi:hypothetical protein
MKLTKRIAPPYSILFISDRDLGEPLEPSREPLQWSDTAVRISCLNEQDGSTTIVLGHVSEVGLTSPPAFNGEIKTPNKQIVVSTALLETVLAIDVSRRNTRIWIWRNHPTEPDEIVVGIE